MAFYEKQLDKLQQAAYLAMKKGFEQMEPAIRVPLLDGNGFSDVYTCLRLDHPELFYLTGFRLRAVPGADYGELLPEYLFEKSKIQTHRQAISARTARLIREAKELSENDKIAFLHRFICENVSYDKLEKPYSHEVIGPLTQGVGVCEGIAKSVKLLADGLKIPCLVALSAPAEGKKYGHAWNIIQRGGKWYHLDATFDLSLSKCGEMRCDYLLLGDDQIYRDHNKTVFSVPACTDCTAFAYKEQRLSLTKLEDVGKRTAQAVKKKKPRLIFHWRGGYLTRETLQVIVKKVISAAEEAGGFAEITLNWPQAVFCVKILAKPSGNKEPELESTEEI